MPRVNKAYEDKQLRKIVRQVGAMLRFFREESKLSQNALSRVSGVSISTINEIENLLVNDIRLSTISTLARNLKRDPIELIVTPKFDLPEEDLVEFKKAVETLSKISRRLIKN